MYMKCPECGEQLQLIEEVSGTSIYNINEDGSVDYDDKDCTSKSQTSVECLNCSKSFDWEWDLGCIKIILNEE